MDYITGIQNAINYIEEHITEEPDITEIAKKAAVSPFYFQRIFGILCGITLGEYIRSRRLSLAGSELSSTDIRVIDAALKYGYDSPESFTRAFVRFHGITPSQAKKENSSLKSFSRISVQIILKGGSIMNYQIVKKEAFKVLQKVETHTVQQTIGQKYVIDSENKNSIVDFWTRSHKDGTVDTLVKQANDKSYIYGICYNSAYEDSNQFDYGIAAAYGGGEIPDGYSVYEIPARTWAVFECIGPVPDAIQETMHRIFTEFFPASIYQPTYEMDIEAYPELNTDSDEYKTEIWIPLKLA